jgi:hypothetical protein
MGSFDPRTEAVAQRGLGYYCEPARARAPGETTSPEGSACTRREYEIGKRVRGVGESGKVRKTSCLGRPKNRATQLQSQGNLRGKRSDP